MLIPDPLPQPGAWLVLNDDELYEVVCPEPVKGEPLPLCSDESGVYYLSVNDGEVIWTPWDDDSVTAVFPTLAEAEAYTDARNGRTESRRVDVLAVTIRHDQPEPPTPAMLTALAEVVAAACELAGIRASVTAEHAPADPEDGGEGCQQPSRPDGHHRISDSLCADCLEFV